MFIDVYGIQVKITGSARTCKAIAQDFSYFLPKTSKKQPNILLEIKQRKAPIFLLPSERARQIRSEYIIYPDPQNPTNAYFVDYHGQAVLHVKKSATVEAQLWCENPDLAHELSYLFLQSQIGLMLDRRGIHRVHACGFANSKTGKNTLVLIPSGGGKSTLAIALSKYREISLLSDDSPLITKNGMLLPYPLRLAFTEHAQMPVSLENKTKKFQRRKYGTKKLLNISHLPFPPSMELMDAPLPVHRIILASRHGSLQKPKLSAVGKSTAAAALIRDLIIGIGIPQMAEHMLSNGFKSAPALIPNAISRTVTVANLLRKAHIYELVLSQDLKANAEILL